MHPRFFPLGHHIVFVFIVNFVISSSSQGFRLHPLISATGSACVEGELGLVG